MVSNKSIGKKEIEIFKGYFSDYKEQYVLIGGSATKLVLEDADLVARATKDLDIVLCAKALSKDFVQRFWEFIKSGGYEIKKKSNGKSVFYRFEKPSVENYPYMIELLSERDAYFDVIDQVVLPLVIDDAIISLSAIILNQEYYDFLMENKVEFGGIILADERLLIPLKVTAYLDLKRKREAGVKVKEEDIKKHRNDVIRLSGLLSATPVVNVPNIVKEEMKVFIDLLTDDGGVLKNLGVQSYNIESIKELLRIVYSVR